MATKKQEASVSAVALCAGSFDGIARIPAGAVVEGVPAAVAEANTNWLDAAPAAVEHAKAEGAPTLEYEG